MSNPATIENREYTAHRVTQCRHWNPIHKVGSLDINSLLLNHFARLLSYYEMHSTRQL